MKKVEVLTAQDQKIRTTACLQCLHRMRYSLSTVFYSVSTVNLQSLKQLYLCEMLKLIGFSKDKRYCYAKSRCSQLRGLSRIVKGIRN